MPGKSIPPSIRPIPTPPTSTTDKHPPRLDTALPAPQSKAPPKTGRERRPATSRKRPAPPRHNRREITATNRSEPTSTKSSPRTPRIRRGSGPDAGDNRNRQGRAYLAQASSTARFISLQARIDSQYRSQFNRISSRLRNIGACVFANRSTPGTRVAGVRYSGPRGFESIAELKGPEYRSRADRSQISSLFLGKEPRPNALTNVPRRDSTAINSASRRDKYPTSCRRRCRSRPSSPSDPRDTSDPRWRTSRQTPPGCSKAARPRAS